MSDLSSIEWFERLGERVNLDPEFRDAARWFQGTVAWQVDDREFSLKIDNGQVQSVEPGSKGARFSLAGKQESWEELMALGTINRLFRQKKIKILGDKVAAMRYWKILWYLTEIGRKM